MIKFAKFPTAANPGIYPTRAYQHDAGMDLYSPIDYTIKPASRAWIPLGLSCEFPPGYVLLIQERSSHAFIHGMFTMGNVIDCGYRGEIKVCLINFSQREFQINKGDRIAQALLLRLGESDEIKYVEYSELTPSERGSKGTGSSGQ